MTAVTWDELVRVAVEANAEGLLAAAARDSGPLVITQASLEAVARGKVDLVYKQTETGVLAYAVSRR